MSSKKEIDLYQCTDEDGEMKVKQKSLIVTLHRFFSITFKINHVKCGSLRKDDLRGDDSFIVDGHASLGIWVWIGKKATPAERREGMATATRFLAEKGYPKETRITRVVQGGENQEFQSLFTFW